MDKRITTTDRHKKNLEMLNNEIKVINIERGKWGYIVTLKCVKCGNVWNITEKGYKLNPSCPICREKIAVSEQCGKKMTNEEWVERAKTVHPEYDFSKTDYKNSQTPVIITCKRHGDFTITPKIFMKRSYKCAKCKKEEKLFKEGEEFIKKCKEIHPDYDYSKTVFKGIKQKVFSHLPKTWRFLSACKVSYFRFLLPKMFY